jgi:hypothetical protein
MLLLLLGCVENGVNSVDKSPATFDTGDAPDTPPVDTATKESPPPDSGGTVAPPPEEVCDGDDDDGDGAIDEDFPDTDADGTADCVDVEECDGLDNDGDGGVDEDFDADTDGIPDCSEQEYDVGLHVTADDAFEAFFDGVSVYTDSNWGDAHDVATVMDSGPHVVAVHAWDLYGMPSALMALVEIDGAAYSLTGDPEWIYTRTSPDVTWADVGFDDSAWTNPDVCTGGWWGSLPADLAATGAAWVWEGDCTGTGEAWFRVDLDLP